MRTLKSTSTATRTLEEEATKAKLKELERLAEFGMHEVVDMHTALGKKRVTTRWNLDHRKDGMRARFVAREFKGDETLYDVFAPGSTPSAGRVIDHLSLKMSYHTFTADVTNAYFHVDEDEECYVDAPAEWQAALGSQTSVLWRLRKQFVWPETRWDALGRAGETSWQNALTSRVLTGVTQHHNSSQIMSWMFSLRSAWTISMAPDLRTTWFKPTSHRISDSKSGQCSKWE